MRSEENKLTVSDPLIQEVLLTIQLRILKSPMADKTVLSTVILHSISWPRESHWGSADKASIRRMDTTLK